MNAAEFMDACRNLFECGVDSDNDELMNTILHLMNKYMEKYPDEIKVGAVFSELGYTYAVKRQDKDAILAALEKKCDYANRIIAQSMKKRVQSLEQYIEINMKILDLELDGLTGFKSRKAYNKDIEFIEQDKVISAKPVGVIFADVNGLKKVNDSFGHEAGDELIESVAKAITEIFPDAKKYRFGGDEFVILSFDKNKAIFDEKLARLSTVWKNNQFSASIGSVWMEHAVDLEKSVAAADEMMYTNKSRYYEKNVNQ